MQYQAAKTEMQSRPPRVSWTGAAFEAIAMLAITGVLVWVI